jgi:hypothetical protein
VPSWTWADTNQVQATANVLSVIVTLIGFVLLWRQIKRVDLSARGQTHSYLYTHQDSITRFFIDRPNLRPFFYDNVEVSNTESDYVTIKAVTEMVADFAEHIYLQLPNLPKDIREGWEFYMKNLYNRSPILRTHFRDNGDWYSEDFIKTISSLYSSSTVQEEKKRVSN